MIRVSCVRSLSSGKDGVSGGTVKFLGVERTPGIDIHLDMLCRVPNLLITLALLCLSNHHCHI